jgi:hypothetical protein
MRLRSSSGEGDPAVIGLTGTRHNWSGFGNRHARFGSFLRSPPATWRYASLALRGCEPRYVGHDPCLHGRGADRVRGFGRAHRLALRDRPLLGAARPASVFISASRERLPASRCRMSPVSSSPACVIARIWWCRWRMAASVMRAAATSTDARQRQKLAFPLKNACPPSENNFSYAYTGSSIRSARKYGEMRVHAALARSRAHQPTT